MPDNSTAGTGKDAAREARRQSRKNRYPAPEHRRCDAIAKPSSDYRPAWAQGSHRCGKLAHFWRGGHQFCRLHYEMPNVRCVPGCGDRVAAYEAAMAKALGDEP